MSKPKIKLPEPSFKKCLSKDYIGEEKPSKIPRRTIIVEWVINDFMGFLWMYR
ncbi:hypothetical protein [Staphylothermus hellenicus]|uniref:hypothetical protein n=1 Tax=Staphylothermus hellenicus TaxID=84599 RepID=UPI0001C43D0B|nr:hypothetical protein [Staphylothermus hellenicus]